MNEQQAEQEYSKINEELKVENPQLLLDAIRKIREKQKKKEELNKSPDPYEYGGEAVPDEIEKKMKDQLRILLEMAGETKQDPQVNYVVKIED